MKSINNAKNFVETTDVRDGLFPSLRYALTQMQKMNDENNGKFQKSGILSEKVATELLVDKEEVYACLIDATWPRCELPLVDGHGNMGFPPADMHFSEMRISDFYQQVTHNEIITDCHTPLLMPIPYVLSNGTIGNKNETRIPSHNLGEIIEATIALIKEPNIETKDLMQYIKGPDLLIGGEIANKENLCAIYEKGYGVIEVRVTPQTFNNRFIGKVSDYCRWYEIKSRKKFFKNEQRILIRYNALLFDGKTSKLMSLKEILQKYIEYYLSIENNATTDDLCKNLEAFKGLSGDRITIS